MFIAEIKEQNIMLRFCRTCKMIQGLRVFHCKTCNLCVTRHDHHCPWLSKCIGSRNHKLFVALIGYVLLHCSYVSFILSYLLILLQEKPITFDFVISIILIIGNCLFFIFVFVLFIFQIRVIIYNQTTSEYLLAEKGYRNPFDLGWKKNTKQYFYNIEGFKSQIKLNESATVYLNNTLLADYIKEHGDVKMAELVNTSSISTDKSENL
jgi:hypothetical protein